MAVAVFVIFTSRFRACKTSITHGRFKQKSDSAPGPVITAAAAYNVGSAVSSVTLVGMQFGVASSTVTAVLSLADCGTSSWASATSVECIGTRGAGAAGTGGVRVLGAAGTSSAVFSFDGIVMATARAIDPMCFVYVALPGLKLVENKQKIAFRPFHKPGGNTA